MAGTDSSSDSEPARKKRKRSKDEKSKRSKKKHKKKGAKHKHKHKHKRKHKRSKSSKETRLSSSASSSSEESTTPSPAHLEQVTEIFNMILAISPAARSDLLYMLGRFDKGKSVTLGDASSSVQVKELLLSAFRLLRLQTQDSLSFHPRRRTKTNLLSTFAWLKTPTTKPSISSTATAAASSTVQEESSSEEEGDVGPQPVSAGKVRKPSAAAVLQSGMSAGEGVGSAAERKTKRHEWMTELPETGVSRSIAFLQKPRQFNQSKAAGSARDSSGWTSVPQQSGEGAGGSKRSQPRQIESIVPKANLRADEALRKQMAAFNEKSRGESLLAEHKRAKPEEEGKKAFSWNRERDMAFSKVDAKHTKKIVDGANDLSSRFARPQSSRQFL